MYSVVSHTRTKQNKERESPSNTELTVSLNKTFINFYLNGRVPESIKSIRILVFELNLLLSEKILTESRKHFSSCHYDVVWHNPTSFA